MADLDVAFGWFSIAVALDEITGHPEVDPKWTECGDRMKISMASPATATVAGFLGEFTDRRGLVILAGLELPARELQGRTDKVMMLFNEKNAVIYLRRNPDLIGRFDPVVFSRFAIRGDHIVAV